MVDIHEAYVKAVRFTLLDMLYAMAWTQYVTIKDTSDHLIFEGFSDDFFLTDEAESYLGDEVDFVMPFAVGGSILIKVIHHED